MVLKTDYSQIGEVQDKFDVLNFLTASTTGLLISVFSLIFGLLAGWGNTVNPSSGGIGVRQPLFIIFLAFIFMVGIYSILSLLEMVRDRWGPIRKILKIS
jgi:hypothetical protein